MGMDRKEGGGSILVWPPLLFFLNVFNRLQIWDGFHSITSCVLLQCSCVGIALGPAHLAQEMPQVLSWSPVWFVRTCPGPHWVVSPPWGGLLSVHAALSLCVHPQLDKVDGIPPSSKPSSDPQQDISEIRCTLHKMLSLPFIDEIAKVCHDTVGVLVVLSESFQGCEPLGASNSQMNSSFCSASGGKKYKDKRESGLAVKSKTMSCAYIFPIGSASELRACFPHLPDQQDEAIPPRRCSRTQQKILKNLPSRKALSLLGQSNLRCWISLVYLSRAW